MKDHRLLKKLLYGKLSQGKHSWGDQKKHFKEILKVSMKSFSITTNCLEYLALDRDKWCEVVKFGVKVCEARRNAVSEQCRKLRKALPHQPLPPPFLVLTAKDSSSHRLVSLVITTFTDTFLDHKIDQMVLIKGEKNIYTNM